MSITAVDHVHLSHLGAVYFSEELVAFGTTGVTEVRAYPVADTVDFTPEQVQTPTKTLAPVPFDPRDPAKGDKGGTVKVTYYLQPASAVMDGAAVSVPTT